MALNHACLPVPAPAPKQARRIIIVFIPLSSKRVAGRQDDSRDMDKLPGYKKSLSMHFGSRLHRDEGQTATALRWLAVVSLFIFLTLLAIKLLQNNIKQAVPLSIGVLPILVSL